MDEPNVSAAPWWGKAQNIIWTLGPVTVAFFLILAVGLGWFPSPMLQHMMESSAILAKNQKLISDIRDDLNSHAHEVREGQNGVLRALRQICRNTAKTSAQNERCDEMNP